MGSSGDSWRQAVVARTHLGTAAADLRVHARDTSAIRSAAWAATSGGTGSSGGQRGQTRPAAEHEGSVARSWALRWWRCCGGGVAAAQAGSPTIARERRETACSIGGDAAAASCQLPLPRAHNKATRQAAHSQEKYTNTSRHPVVSLSASVSTASRQCRPGRCVCRPSPCPAFFVRRPRRRWHRLSDCPCDCDSRKSLSWQNLLQNGRETAPASAPTHPARGPSR